MKRSTSLVVLTLIVASLTACNKEADTNQASPGPNPTTKAATKAEPVAAAKPVEAQPYLVSGTRDPFQPYLLATPTDLASVRSGAIRPSSDPLKIMTLSQLQLVGTIMGKDRRAMVQDAANTGYIVRIGTRMGEDDGVVTKITPDSITIQQHYQDYTGQFTTREVIMALKLDASMQKRDGGN